MSLEALDRAKSVGERVGTVNRVTHVNSTDLLREPIAFLEETEVPQSPQERQWVGSMFARLVEAPVQESTFVAVDPDAYRSRRELATLGVESRPDGSSVLEIIARCERAAEDPTLIGGLAQLTLQEANIDHAQVRTVGIPREVIERVFHFDSLGRPEVDLAAA